MSKYDEFRDMFGDTSPEEKLSILRAESKRLLPAIQNYGLLLNMLIEERQPKGLPDDFSVWCKKVADYAKECQDVIDALTDRNHRSVWQKARDKQQQETEELYWSDKQRDLTELQLFKNLKDAIEHTLSQLKFSLPPETIYFPFGKHNRSLYSISLEERRVHIGVQRIGSKYDGYALTLKWVVDKRNMHWKEHHGLAPSLESSSHVIYQWLVLKVDLQSIKQEYSWMQSGKIPYEY